MTEDHVHRPIIGMAVSLNSVISAGLPVQLSFLTSGEIEAHGHTRAFRK